jgi:hypothetical protein
MRVNARLLLDNHRKTTHLLPKEDDGADASRVGHHPPLEIRLTVIF